MPGNKNKEFEKNSAKINKNIEAINDSLGLHKERIFQLNAEIKEYLLLKSKINKNGVLTIFLLLTLILIFLSLLFFKPPIIAKLTMHAVDNEKTIVEHVNLTLSRDQIYNLNNINIKPQDEILYLKITGKVIGDGDVHLVFSSKNKNYTILKINKAENMNNQSENHPSIDPFEYEFIYNNRSEQNSRKLKIDIELSYKNGTPWDYDDDGIETDKGIIDFTIENSNFSWNVNENKLCTIWEILSLENMKSIRKCYGSEMCCDWQGFFPVPGMNWSTPLDLFYGRYGASNRNIVRSRVAYIDYRLSEDNPYLNSSYSEWSSLTAVFYNESTMDTFEFGDYCEDTCKLNNIKNSEHNLIIKIDEGTVLKLDTISARVIARKNQEPIWESDVEDLVIGKNSEIELNLSKHFFDPDGDNISYGVVKAKNLMTLLEGDLLTIKPTENFTGETSIYLEAKDSMAYTRKSLNVFVVESNETFEEPASTTNITLPCETSNDSSYKQVNVSVLEEEINFTKDGMIVYETFDKDKKIKIAEFNKKGFKIKIVGVNESKLNNINYMKGVLHVDSIPIKNATIKIPRKKQSPVTLKPKLFIKGDNEAEFTLAESYTKDNIMFNDIETTPTHYIFNVEHFTDYYVNDSGGDYSKLIDCMVANNNTVNFCSINQGNFSETFNDSYIFSKIGIKTAIVDNVTVNLNSSHLIGGTRHFYIRSTNSTFSDYISRAVSDDDYYGNADGLNVSNVLLDDAAFNTYLTDRSYFYNITQINTNLRAEANKGTFTLNGNNNLLEDISITMGNSPTADTPACISIDGQYNNLTDSYFKGKTRKGIITAGSGTYWNRIENNVVEDSTKGIHTNYISNYIINNSVINCSEECIKQDEGAVGNSITGGIFNNTLTDCGSTTTDYDYLSSFSPHAYNGINFTCVIFTDSAGNFLYVDEDDENVTAKADGTNNFTRFWLYTDDNSPVTSCGAYANITIYLEDGYPNSCAAIQGAYGGTCHLALESNRVWTENGHGNNYTFNTSILDIANITAGYTNPPYLRYNEIPIQEHFPLWAHAGNNLLNISGNTIKTADGRTAYYSANITSGSGAGNYMTNVWLNNFYTEEPLITGYNLSLCVNGEGNFYGESLTPIAGDCGPANVTYPYQGTIFNATAVFTANWTKQSAMSTVTYDVFIKNASDGSLSSLGQTTDLEMSIDASSYSDGYYNLFIIPYISGSRINATNELGDNFTINSSILTGCANLAEANKTYLLASDVTSDLTCFNITAENVTLDCRGHTINYAKDKQSLDLFGVGVLSYKNRTVIKNCTIIRNDTGADFGYGIFLWNSSHSTVVNNTVVTVNNGDNALFIRQSSFSNISNNTISTIGLYAYGILVYLNSTNNDLEGNKIETNSSLGWGVVLYTSGSGNNFRSNNITTWASAAFFFNVPSTGVFGTTAYDINLNQSIDSSNLAHGLPINYTHNVSGLNIKDTNFSIYGQVIFTNCSYLNISTNTFEHDSLTLFYCNNITVDNNTIFSDSSDGILMQSVKYSNITRNRVNISGKDGGNIGIVSYGDADNLEISSNAIYTNTKIFGYGIHTSGTDNSSIYYNNATTAGESAPALFIENDRDLVIRGGNYTALHNSNASVGVYIGKNANASIFDAILHSENKSDIAMVQSRSEINLTNCTFNQSDVDLGEAEYNAKLNLFHYLDGQVNDSKGEMITGAAVLGYDKNNDQKFSTATTAGGIIPRQEVLEYQETASGRTYYTNYTINASYQQRANASEIVNISSNTNLTLTFENNAPELASVLLNATSISNLTTDNLTAYASGINDADGDSIVLNYNWYRDGISDTILNMPFTAPDSTGGNRTYDFSGYDNHGIITCGNDSNPLVCSLPAYNSSGGLVGGAFEFDGIDDYINISHSSSLEPTDFTITSWIKLTGGGVRQSIIQKGTTHSPLNNNGYWLEIHSDNYTAFRIVNSSDNSVACFDQNTKLSINRWYFIAGSYDSSTGYMGLYLNGTEIASCYSGSTGAIDYDGGCKDLRIGVRSFINCTDADNFNGTIDEVRIYNRSLSAHEILLLYNNRTNITHYSTTAAGENWTAKVTPIDEHGLNGTGMLSNGLIIASSLLNASLDCTNCGIQDDDTTCGGSDNFDNINNNTHISYAFDSSTGPRLQWTYQTVNATAYGIKTKLCIGNSSLAGLDETNYGTLCNVVNLYDNSSAVSNEYYDIGNDTFTYNGSGQSRIFYAALRGIVSGEEALSEGITFYTINLTNQLPGTPSNLLPDTTHDQTPSISWTASVDNEDGSGQDKCPADITTYHVTAGVGGTATTDLFSEKTQTSTANSSFFNTMIPWGWDGLSDGWTNETVYVRIWATDNAASALNNSALDETFVLSNHLPDVTSVEITDSGGYSACPACAITPQTHSNATNVAIRVNFTDLDGDCNETDPQSSAIASTAKIYLCAYTSGECSESEYNWTWSLESVTRDGTSSCSYFLLNNLTALNQTPSFWVTNNTAYQLWINVSDQAWRRNETADAQANTTWEYSSLTAVSYPATIILGGTDILMGIWNNGTNEYNMTNWGNSIVDIKWSSTDPTSEKATWELNGSNMYIDDDANQGNEPAGIIDEVAIDSSERFFNYSTGLQRCVSDACGDADQNESMPTHWHIAPTSLPAGTYNATITYTTVRHT